MMIILSFLGGVFSFFGSISEYFKRKTFENSVRQEYETKKTQDALDVSEQTSKMVDDAKNNAENINQTIDMIAQSKNTDIISDIVSIDAIRDPLLKKEMQEKNKIAVDLKNNVDKTIEDIKAGKKFDNGEEIVLRG